MDSTQSVLCVDLVVFNLTTTKMSFTDKNFKHQKPEIVRRNAVFLANGRNEPKRKRNRKWIRSDAKRHILLALRQ